jgi:hypothetical protein
MRERLALYRAGTAYVAEDPKQALLDRWSGGGADDGS